MAKQQTNTPRPTPVQPLPTKSCPGYGESCGTTIPASSDLCGSCSVGRTNTQTPTQFPL